MINEPMTCLTVNRVQNADGRTSKQTYNQSFLEWNSFLQNYGLLQNYSRNTCLRMFITLTPQESSRGQVQKSLQHLKDTFSLIFQALLFLSSSQQVPNSPLEREKVSRRSREFEIRFKRNAFEIKQQV